MDGSLLLFHDQDAMGTIFDAIAAMQTDYRLIAVFIPEHCFNLTGFSTMAAANAFFRF
jgi:hypothetical protein